MIFTNRGPAVMGPCFRRGDGYVFTRASFTRASMTEMSDAREHHGDAVLVGGLDHFLVAH